MLYQLSYTPVPAREVASGRRWRKASAGPAPQPLFREAGRGYLTTGSPIHVPSAPVNTFCVAGR